DQRLLDLLPDDEALDLLAFAYRAQPATAAFTPAEQAVAQGIVSLLASHTLSLVLAGAYARQDDVPLDTLSKQLADNPIDIPKGEEERAVEKSFDLSWRALRSQPQVRILFVLVAALAAPDLGRQATLAIAAGCGVQDPVHALDVLVGRALLTIVRDDTMPQNSDRDRVRIHPQLQAFGKQRYSKRSQRERERAEAARARYFARYVVGTADEALIPDEAQFIAALTWAHAHRRRRRTRELLAALAWGTRYYWILRQAYSVGLDCLAWAIQAVRRPLLPWFWWG